jgi:predicted RecA/RadA family phage recombinase
MATMDGYSVTGYSTGDFMAPGKTLTVLESEVTSHPDHTATIGADRIQKGDPVLVGSTSGIANITTTAATDQVTVETEGIYVVPVVCNGGTALVNGGPVFIHATAGTLHSTYATGMVLFGTALGSGSAASVTVPVRLAPPSIYAPTAIKVASVALAGGAENAIAAAWQNPEATKILVLNTIARITTPGATGGATVDVGKVANATATAKDIFDALAITAAGVFTSLISGGTAGVGSVVLDEKDGTNDYITAKILDAEAAALVGTMYIVYTPVA